MILTDNLAAGAVAAGGPQSVTLYTVPAGKHVRLRRSTVVARTAGGTVTLFLETAPGATTVTLASAAPLAVNTPLNDAGDHVLVAGQKVRVFLAAGTGCDYWVSGTLYSD